MPLLLNAMTRVHTYQLNVKPQIAGVSTLMAKRFWARAIRWLHPTDFPIALLSLFACLKHTMFEASMFPVRTSRNVMHLETLPRNSAKSAPINAGVFLGEAMAMKSSGPSEQCPRLWIAAIFPHVSLMLMQLVKILTRLTFLNATKTEPTPCNSAQSPILVGAQL
jgi:hypothetical protein